ncbi:DUF1934 domain-containing protein [Peptostreptococcus sp. D1]|uniref:DUF1934 domain-containing protein n=1 Tax=Peptostreptococcus sp. D1 TaxID=72304 RepID=UPI0008EEE775|nr:DUF1934 domain-containing protein [Peptostreptococcus sp. D1]SFE77447.1 Uncharacterized beta-barrel protein YwiB, DUF1934 family [Peptostreptococcus sp. D1]
MDVKITIKTSQILEAGDIQTIESFYNGKKTLKSTGIFLAFEENGNMKKYHRVIKIGDKEVAIINSGDSSSKMKFVENESHNSIYRTPYGSFDMSIYTYKIKKKILENEVKLNLDYKIEIKGLMKANNRIEIKAIAEE